MLPAVVLLVFAGALAGASLAPAPAHLPALALGAVLVWRVEVAASLFVAAYVAVVAIHLSLHGRTFTRVGSAGVEIPDLTGRRAPEHEAGAATAETHALLREIKTTMSEIDVRVRALEHARDVLLRFDRGDLA